MTKIEQTISNLKKLKSFHNGSYGADIDRAIKALEQEPCEDCISREDALMALTGEWTELTDEIIHRFIKRIKSLPSVVPQYTKDEIQKIQDLEQAEIEKAYKLGKAEGQESEE